MSTETKTRADPSGPIPFRQRLGRCYELSGRFASHHPDVVLIHGSIQGMDLPRINHAWIRLPEGYVWEPSQLFGEAMPEPEFNAIFSPRIHVTYTHEQTLAQILRHMHWGPWHDHSSK